MSKRSAGWQGGEERYGAYAGQQQQEDMSQQPQQATAAQLAKRKIASLKGSRRPRSESPLTTGGSIFEQANQSGLMVNNNNMMQNQNNSFSSQQGFNFGGGNANGVSSSFGSGGNSSFNFGGTTQPTQPSTSSFTFGGTSTTPSTNSFTFGSSQPQEKQTNGQTSGTGFSFGQPQENGTAPKPVSNIFGGAFGAQSSAPSSNMFSTAQNTPSNPFAAMNQTSQDTSKGFSFGNNTNNEVKTPQPVSNASNGGSIFAGFGQTQAKPVEQPSSNGWSSFLGQNSATPKPAVSDGLAPSTSIFATSSQTNGPTNGTSQNVFGNAPSKTPTFDFGAKSQATVADNDASMMSPENTPQKPATQNIDIANTNGFSTHAATDQNEANKSLFASNKGKSLFERITKDPVNTTSEAPSPATNLFTAPKPSTSLFTASTPAVSSSIFAPSKPAAEPTTKSFQPQSSLFQPSAKTTAPVFDAAEQPTAQQATTTAKVTSMESTAPEHFDAIRELNEGLTQHLQEQDNERDWSSIFQFYQLQVAKINGTPLSIAKPATAQSSTNLGASMLGKSSLSQPTTSLFAKSATPASVSTEPLSKSTSTAQAEYPKLPENSSATAKLFESTLDQTGSAQNKQASSLFTPSTTAASIFSQNNSNSATSTFKPSTSSLFAPQTNGDKTNTTKSAPSSGFVMPKAASSSSFLSSFGAQAKANEEKEKKRRRDEDFDSDEDDAAEWEKKDAEEQAAKKAKIEEAAKSATGFVFKPSSDKPAPSIFSNVKTSNGESTSENTQGEDHTWKQGTPIKFGGAPTDTTTPKAPGVGLFGSSTKTPSLPPGSGLFGASIAPQSNSTGSIFGAVKTPQTTNASIFSQPAASASKSDEQVNGEAADGDAEPLLPQLADMAVLLDSEQSENDVLYHVEKAKSRKNELRHMDGKGEQLTWVEKGLGPVWILRNKSTGKARVLQKVKDSGRVVMNFAVLKGFEPRYGGAKSVVCTFVDHLTGKDSSKPSSWQIQVGKVEDAKEIDRILREESKKA